jgi:hypothetical protein
VLERLRQKLLVVRELTVDATCRQPYVIRSEDDLVLVHAELDVVAGRRDACELAECARRNDRLQFGHLAAELRLFH